MILFSLLFAVHLWQAARYRNWYLLCFSVGELHISRSLSAKVNPYNLIYFIIQYFFIVTAPVFLSAGIYTILSALIHRLGREHSLLPPKVILWIFMTSDAIATVAQIAGAARTPPPPTTSCWAGNPTKSSPSASSSCCLPCSCSAPAAACAPRALAGSKMLGFIT